MSDRLKHPCPESGRLPDARRRRFVEILLRCRFAVLAAALVLTVLLGGQATRLRTNWNEQEELSARDPEVRSFREFLGRFGGQEYLLVVLQADELFTPDGLGYLRDLTEALRDVPNAADVVSLATVSIVRGEAGDLRAEPFFAEPPATREAASALFREATGQPLWLGSLLSADGRTACINIMLPAMSTNVNDRLVSVAAVREIVRNHPHSGIRIAVTGLSPLAADMMDTLENDLRRFLWLTPALILASLILAFRTWRGVVAPAVVIAVSVLWTMGLLAANGGSLNVCTTMLPTLVAINCLSYVIHLLNAYHESCARGSDHRKVLVLTLVHLVPALFMSSLTTAIGFGTQTLSELRSLRELGLFSALGILLAFVLCSTLVPAMLSFLPMPARKAHRHRNVRLLRRVLWRTAGFVNRDVWKVPAVLCALLAVAGAGMAKIRVEAQIARHLSEAKPSIQGLRVVDEHLAGFYVLEIEVAGDPGTFWQPWALREIDRLQRHVAGLAGVDQVGSIADLFRAAHRVRTAPAAGAGPDLLPETPGQIAEYRLLFSVAGTDARMDPLATRDGAAARLPVRIRGTTTSVDLLRIVGEVDEWARRELDPRLAVHTTGVVKLFALKNHALVRSLFKSFGLSFVLIALALGVLFRSAKVVLCAMIPNVLPIVLGFGLMGWLDVPLNASTVMIASVGIGIAVDDTVHFLLRYRRERRADRSAASAVRRTYLGTGRAIVYSTLGLAAGFSILILSDFRLNREFGLLNAFIMVAALMADLFVTPYLARAFDLFRKAGP